MKTEVLFASRADAARQLAHALYRYRSSHPLILAIPRGAVPMGQALAQTLGGDFDVVLVRKLRAPFSEELAVGAVDETGWVYVAEHAESCRADADYLARERETQMGVLRRRREQYTPDRPPLELQGRTVIVVDDGLATGATMIAALHAARARGAARLICAVPVAAPDSLERVRPYADEVVCLYSPASFYAVGQFYGSFEQVSDAEVADALATQHA